MCVCACGKWLCDSTCVLVFTDIYLHMSRPRPIRKLSALTLVLRGEKRHTKLPVVAACYTFIIAPDKIVSAPDTAHLHTLSDCFCRQGKTRCLDGRKKEGEKNHKPQTTPSNLK